MKTGNIMIGSIASRIGSASDIYEANDSKYYSVPFKVKNTQWTIGCVKIIVNERL